MLDVLSAKTRGSWDRGMLCQAPWQLSRCRPKPSIAPLQTGSDGTPKPSEIFENFVEILEGVFASVLLGVGATGNEFVEATPSEAWNIKK